MKRLLFALVIPCFLLSAPLVQAAAPNAGPASPVQPAGQVDHDSQGQFTLDSHHSLAKIERIDLAAMTATLALDDGKKVEVKLDPKVKNLDKVHVGDTLDIKKMNSLLVYPIKKNDTAESYKLKDVRYDVAPNGKPIKYLVETRVLNATIKDLNRTAHTVTLETAEGKTETFKLSKPMPGMSKAKKGDRVYARYTETVTVMVHPPKAAVTTTAKAAAK